MTPPPSTLARAALRLAPLAAASVLLAGCQLTNPIQTDEPYVPADGVPVDLQDVRISNLLVVADEKDGPGTISGAAVNRSGEAATVTFTPQGGAPVTAQVPAHGQVQFSQDSKVTLPTVAAEPGALLTLQVSTQSAGASIVQVPVLPATGYYEELAP